MRTFGLACVVLSVLSVAFCASDRPAAKAYSEAQDRLRELTPRLAKLEAEFSNDPEGLLGLATLYDRYAVTPELGKRSEQLYRKVVDVEPQNRAAFLGLALRVLVVFTAQRERVLSDLEMQREYASRKGLKEVEIPSWGGGLYEWLREDGLDRVVITDFNEARSRLVQKSDRDLPTVLAILSKGRELDPNNAAYDYLQAALDFELGKDDEALWDVERGAKKPELENYRTQMASARRKALRAVEFPDNYLRVIEESQANVGVFVDSEKVFQMAKQYEARHDLARAGKVYEALLRVANQFREERIPGYPGAKRGDNQISRHIEARAKQELTAIRHQDK